jgi:ActR/RegA family two-component response regulator
MADAKPLALVLEDDAAAGEALALVLSDWGAEVALCADHSLIHDTLGPRLSRTRWIITDFNLGDGPDGVALARVLVQTAIRARVLVLSGSFHGRAAAEAAAAGFEIMTKPARTEAIIAWLERG